MTAEPVTVEPPRHPLPALTTYELSRYRRELEHALKALPGHAAVRGPLQQRLAEVQAEQDSRTPRRPPAGHEHSPSRARPAAPVPPSPGKIIFIPNGLRFMPRRPPGPPAMT
jgi:hypothetical protein